MVTAPQYPPAFSDTVINQWFSDIETWINSGSAPANFVYRDTFYVKKNGSDFEAYNSQGVLTYGGSADAGGIDGGDAGEVIDATLDNGYFVKLADNTTFPCTSWRLKISDGQTLIGANSKTTLLSFTGAGGVDIGDKTSNGTEYGAYLADVKLYGDASGGSIGIQRCNCWYSNINRVIVDNFETGFIEESFDTGVNIVNFTNGLVITSAKYGAVWRKRSPAGSSGNNLNVNYGLMCYGNDAAGSIGYDHQTGQGNVVLGGWCGDFKTGINVSDGEASQFKAVWTENCDTHVNLGANADWCDVDIIMFWVGGETTVADAGTFNTVKLSKTGTVTYYGNELQMNNALTWKVGTAISRQGTSSQLYIGHDASDNLIYNAPSGQVHAWLVNGVTQLTLYSTGKLLTYSGSYVDSNGDIWLADTNKFLRWVDEAASITCDGSDLILNTNAGGGLAFRVNGSGVQYIYSDGDLQYLKVKNVTVETSVPGTGTGSYTFNFPLAEPDTNYGVAVSVSWDTTVYISNKATGSCVINFGTVTPDGNQKVDAMLFRT